MKFFPTIDDVIDHALAFSRVMVAHAGFEAEVRNLQSTIVGDETFGEQPCNQWPADKRPARMANLIKERLGEIEEIHPIKALLARAIKPTRARNLLAHGTWWCFDPETSTITVRHGTVRPGEPVHVEWTADGIKRVAETFLDLEAELFNLRRDLELNWFEADWPYLE
jgi:hypothetical protein